jgi:phosphotriesterase-related protein
MTVLGPVAAEQLGVTLPHEHVFIDLMREYRGDGLLHDEALAASELAAFKGAGGSTILECTSEGLGRDPLALRRAAQATGLNLVMGCGHYREPYLDRERLDRLSVDDLADEIVRDLEIGVGDTGVRAGVIGEIGCGRFISALEERSFRAAARAHRRTGVTITTHAARWPVGLTQLNLLAEEGVDPRRVIVGHCDLSPTRPTTWRSRDAGPSSSSTRSRVTLNTTRSSALRTSRRSWRPASRTGCCSPRTCACARTSRPWAAAATPTSSPASANASRMRP